MAANAALRAFPAIRVSAAFMPAKKRRPKPPSPSAAIFALSSPATISPPAILAVTTVLEGASLVASELPLESTLMKMYQNKRP
jgi:hypothetical protein